MVESIAHFKHILGIPGNHDRFSKWQVRRIIEGCNGIWLENRSAFIRTACINIQIDGGRPAAHSGVADFSILCLHKPIDVVKIAHSYDLVFAGHLHGSQAVLWSNARGLYPGRLMYKWNRLSASFGNCHYLISKGLGDTLPIRYNCRKDFLFVELKSAFPFQNKT
jgi:predicted MPP superfamily phosphohydrolase